MKTGWETDLYRRPLRERRGKDGMKRDLLVTDRIGRAFAREREARFWPVWQPTFSVVHSAVFKCVCCGRQRRAEERRESESEVCVHCVRAAVPELV